MDSDPCSALKPPGKGAANVGNASFEPAIDGGPVWYIFGVSGVQQVDRCSGSCASHFNRQVVPTEFNVSQNCRSRFGFPLRYIFCVSFQNRGSPVFPSFWALGGRFWGQILGRPKYRSRSPRNGGDAACLYCRAIPYSCNRQTRGHPAQYSVRK